MHRQHGLNLRFDCGYLNKADLLLGGIDEVGRGSLAGPLYVAYAMVSRKTPVISGVNDSKKLRPNQRAELEPELKRTLEGFGIAWATAAEINRLGLMPAIWLAVSRLGLRSKKNNLWLLGGNYAIPEMDGIPQKMQTVVKGDQQSYAIAAASILAKVERDRVMETIHVKYPGYNFFTNKGYGTKKHIEAIKLHGICSEHRLQFVHHFIEPAKKSGYIASKL